MDNRNDLLLFVSLAILFAFTFVFGWDGLAVPETRSGFIAFVGFLFTLSVSIFKMQLLRKDGGAMLPWFGGFAILQGIVFVWFLTRVGTAMGLW